MLPSRADSYERICHDSGVPHFLLDLTPSRQETLRRRLADPRLERFIGVIYRPETERWSHYSQAVLPRQFDLMIHLDATRALVALDASAGETAREAPETYPSAL